MIISMRDAWKKAEGRHFAYIRREISTALRSSNPSVVTNPKLKTLLTDANFVRDVAIGRPDALRGIIVAVENWRENVATKSECESFDEQVKAVFSYKRFIDKENMPWNAYELCKLSLYRLCPYCQQAYAFTVVGRNKPKTGKRGKPIKAGSEKRGFRPTLDHYYPKSKYPYLALSLHNLVPACSTCNSSLKSQTDFYVNAHLHPLEDPACLKFEIGARAYLQYRERPGAGLQLNAVCQNPQLQSAADASIESFMLNKRYGVHTHELARWIECIRHWTPSAVAEQASRHNVRPEKLNQFEAMLFNFDRNRHEHEMLGRIKLDIYDAVNAGRLVQAAP